MSEPPSSIAGAAILAAGPLGIIVFVALLLADLSVLASFALTVAVQLVVLGSIVVIGNMVQSRADARKRVAPDQPSDDREPPESWNFHARSEGVRNPFCTALVARRTGQTGNIARVLTEIGSDVHQCADQDALLETVQARPDIWDLVIYDIDVAPDLPSAITDLMDFRTACPGVPVILLSDAVARDDFSRHRRAIGDITLRKPVFRMKMIEAVRYAKLHHDPAARQSM